MDTGDDRFVASVLIRAYIVNNGMDLRDLIDLITYVVPTLAVKQATNVLYWTFKKKHSGIDIGRRGPEVKIYWRKLDALSYVKSDSGIVNNPDNLKRLKDRLDLATSTGDILDYQADIDKDKNKNLHKDTQDMVVAAEQKLNNNNGDDSKITKIEIASILCIRYKKEVTPSRMYL